MPSPLLTAIETALESAKALDPLVLDLRPERAYCDYVVIASGTSDRHVEAISAHIREAVKVELQRLPLGVEGDREGVWILMDYGEVVVHLFQPETRELYRLEDLWRKAVPKNRANPPQPS